MFHFFFCCWKHLLARRKKKYQTKPKKNHQTNHQRHMKESETKKNQFQPTIKETKNCHYISWESITQKKNFFEMNSGRVLFSYAK